MLRLSTFYLVTISEPRSLAGGANLKFPLFSVLAVFLHPLLSRDRCTMSPGAVPQFFLKLVLIC